MCTLNRIKNAVLISKQYYITENCTTYSLKFTRILSQKSSSLHLPSFPFKTPESNSSSLRSRSPLVRFSPQVSGPIRHRERRNGNRRTSWREVGNCADSWEHSFGLCHVSGFGQLEDGAGIMQTVAAKWRRACTHTDVRYIAGDAGAVDPFSNNGRPVYY